jgi:hypothetical protein
MKTNDYAYSSTKVCPFETAVSVLAKLMRHNPEVFELGPESNSDKLYEYLSALDKDLSTLYCISKFRTKFYSGVIINNYYYHIRKKQETVPFRHSFSSCGHN